MQTYNYKLIEPAVKSFLGENHNLDLSEWIKDPNNIVLVNDFGDLALFEKRGTWQVHCYFKSRGRSAITAGLNFLDEIFNSCYNIKVLTGLTPLSNLKARWFAKKIGFKSQGAITLNDQPFELFMLINKDTI